MRTHSHVCSLTWMQGRRRRRAHGCSRPGMSRATPPRKRKGAGGDGRRLRQAPTSTRPGSTRSQPAEEALDLRSGPEHGRGAGAGPEMRPWRTVPVVQGVHDRLLNLMAG